MTRVFICADGMDASSEYSASAPADTLNQLDPSGELGAWRVDWGTGTSRLDTDYQVICGLRLTGPQPDWLRWCANPDVLCVYVMDDDLINLDPRMRGSYERYAPQADDTALNVTAADRVICCTEWAAERMSRLNPEVRLIPICGRERYLTPPTPRDVSMVGYAGSWFKVQDFDDLCEPLALLSAHEPALWMNWLGADYCPRAFPGRTRETRFTSYPEYMATLPAAFQIGLAPLGRFDHNRGKSWTKLWEYSAAGIPAVATRWGQYEQWGKEAGTLLVDEHHDTDWVGYVRALLHDPPMRHSLATAAYEQAARWTIEANIGMWAEALTP